MSANPNFKALVYAQNAVKARTATSNKMMMTTISIDKYSHSTPMTEMAPTHETQWKKIQYFNCLSNILRGQLGSNSVANIVTAMSNVIPTETAAEYKEARMVSNVVEGATTKSGYLNGIGFLNGKGDPMTAFPKGAEKSPEDIMYLKVLCNLDGAEIDNRILQEPFGFQFCL